MLNKQQQQYVLNTFPVWESFVLSAANRATRYLCIKTFHDCKFALIDHYVLNKA